jgi:hypothetical protein
MKLVLGLISFILFHRQPMEQHCRGLVPWAPRVTGYDRFPLGANGWRTIQPVPDATPPLLAKEEGSSI